MRESYDTALNNIKQFMNNEISNLSKNFLKPHTKKEFEEPMLSKKPLHCGSCNREMIHAKLNQPEHTAWNTITSSMYTPRKTAYGSVYTGSLLSNVDTEIGRHEFKRESSKDKDIQFKDKNLNMRGDIKRTNSVNDIRTKDKIRDIKSMTSNNWNRKERLNEDYERMKKVSTETVNNK